MSLTTKVGGDGSNTLFLSIKKGNLVKSGKEGEKGVSARTYKDDDGNEKVTYEHLYKPVTGFITKLEVSQGKFGEELGIFMEKDGERAKVTLKTDSKYFADFAKKAPNIDFTKEVTLSGFDWIPEGKTKAKVGVTLKQDDEKLTGAYWDGKKNVKDYPIMEEENPDSDDWKLYFLQERKYLKKKLALIEIPRVDTGTSAPTLASEPESPLVNSGNDDDLPF